MTLPVNVDLIPEEMRALNRWAVWKPEINSEEGRIKKVSYYTQKNMLVFQTLKHGYLLILQQPCLINTLNLKALLLF